ncbi:MAG TPA: phenylalanine--tRNA ligase beta subunit-related protein [Candidatus Nanoarchaeia archaeon]|nr:hypothetical protein [uncultured archaeon]
MKFVIDKSIFEKFPELLIGVLSVKNLNNKDASPEINSLLKHQEENVRENYNLESLSSQPKIEVWREAYRTFGAKPKENRSSVENLYKMVLSGNNLRHINKLVDIYNVISLKHTLPVGGEDLDKTQGDIQLTFAGANEPDVILLGDKDSRSPHEGEVIYKDEISTICRRWNWREADRTKLTEETKNCILVIEALPPTSKNEVEQATNELKIFVEKFCGGEINSTTLGANELEFQLT